MRRRCRNARKLFKQAVRIAQDNRSCFTVKVLKKQMRIGYLPAYRLLVKMESIGKIGQYKNGKREVMKV